MQKSELLGHVEHWLPLNEFGPVYRGRPVPGAGTLPPSAIRQPGFMLVDKIEGPFQLLIRSIEPLFAGRWRSTRAQSRL